MANENTSTDISTFITNIYEAAVLTAREQMVMPGLVRSFTDQQGVNDRFFSAYSGGTLGSNISENTDLTSQAFTPGTIAKLTPKLYGAQYFITDRRIRSDPFRVQADAGADLGQLLATNVDSLLVGDFGSFTGGTVGSAGGTITWANVLRAITYLRTKLAPAPYFCVLSPGQWYYLANSVAAGQTITNAPGLQDRVADQFFAGRAYSVDFYIDANITAGTAAKGGMFSRDALGLDIRQAYRLEPQRDASRGGGGYELNATMDFAHGVWRATYGVQMIGTDQ